MTFEIYAKYAYEYIIQLKDKNNIDRKISIEYYYNINKIYIDNNYIYIYLIDNSVKNSNEFYEFCRKYPILNHISLGYPDVFLCP
jgi:hypothetical protein